MVLIRLDSINWDFQLVTTRAYEAIVGNMELDEFITVEAEPSIVAAPVTVAHWDADENGALVFHPITILKDWEYARPN